MTFQPIIGLEVHVELATKSKMFCGCPADHFGKTPNTQTCPVCLGLPGALPVPNKKAIDWTILLGLALGCKINQESKFDRKNYFYPDLPKGYQISQYDEPIAENGEIEILDAARMTKKIRIRRVHLEEDTGKLQHAEVDGKKVSLVDFNRCGVPLVEIVTEPDFRSIEEVDIYLKSLQRIIRYLGISNADMEKGSMRLEPSISMALITNKTSFQLPNYRVELKNINSFRFARRALEYEIKRQTEMLERGEETKQQTRGWSEAKNETIPQREKEEANDYRYFPEPDIPPMRFESKQISAIRDQIPELPDDKLVRFVKQYSITEYFANLLTEDKTVADYFEQAVKDGGDPKSIANFMINKKDQLPDVPGLLVQQIAKSQSVQTQDQTAAITQAILENPKAVADYVKNKGAVGIIAKAVGSKTGFVSSATIAEIKGRLENKN